MEHFFSNVNVKKNITLDLLLKKIRKINVCKVKLKQPVCYWLYPIVLKVNAVHNFKQFISKTQSLPDIKYKSAVHVYKLDTKFIA